jgi:hypothetical protein
MGKIAIRTLVGVVTAGWVAAGVVGAVWAQAPRSMLVMIASAIKIGTERKLRIMVFSPLALGLTNLELYLENTHLLAGIIA